MILTYALSMILWVVYAIFINNWPIIITNSLAFVVSSVQLYLMFKFKK